MCVAGVDVQTFVLVQIKTETSGTLAGGQATDVVRVLSSKAPVLPKPAPSTGEEGVCVMEVVSCQLVHLRCMYRHEKSLVYIQSPEESSTVYIHVPELYHILLTCTKTHTPAYPQQIIS